MVASVKSVCSPAGKYYTTSKFFFSKTPISKKAWLPPRQLIFPVRCDKPRSVFFYPYWARIRELCVVSSVWICEQDCLGNGHGSCQIGFGLDLVELHTPSFFQLAFIKFRSCTWASYLLFKFVLHHLKLLIFLSLNLVLIAPIYPVLRSSGISNPIFILLDSLRTCWNPVGACGIAGLSTKVLLNSTKSQLASSVLMGYIWVKSFKISI